MFEAEADVMASFVESTFNSIVRKNKLKIHDIVDEILAREKLSGGKGHKASSVVAARAGKYWLKDPVIEPTRAELKAKCVSARNTRSYIEPLGERLSKNSTVEKLHADAVQECRAAVDVIVRQCKSRGGNAKFFDEDFYFDRRDVMFPAGTPDDCTVAEPKRARRLRELYPKAKLFMDAVSAGDMTQGNLGDCFLVGAIGALAAHSQDALTRLFAAADEEIGIYGVTLFKNGSWEWVIVDDFVAVQSGRSGNLYPLYATSGQGGEVEYWPMILEKAYAKIHNNWDTIDGGWAREALVDLTGGLETSYDLHGANKKMSFKEFSKQVLDPDTILSCSVGEHVESSNEAAGRSGEHGALFGLFHGHQYSVLDAKEHPDGTGFVQVRNPWGNEAEWKGPYSDNDIKWRENPEHKNFINPQFIADGCFWMRWTDFRQYFTDIDVVRKFPVNWLAFTLPFKAEHVSSPDNTFVLRVFGEAAPVTFVYSQEDPKLLLNHEQQKTTTYAPLRMEVKNYERLPATVEELDSLHHTLVDTAKGRERAVYISSTLAPGVYSVQSTIQTKQKNGAGVFLRVFAPPTAHVAVFRWSEGEEKAFTAGNAAELIKVQPLTPPSKPATPALAQSVSSVSLRPASAPATTVAVAAPPPVVPLVPTKPVANVDALQATVMAKLQAQVQEQERLLAAQKAQLDQQAQQLREAQQQLAAAKAEAAKAAAAATAAAAAVVVTQPPSAAVPALSLRPKPSAAGPSPLMRLGMDKGSFRDVLRQVFDELANGKKSVDKATAVNGLRLAVTLGAGMDDAFVQAYGEIGGSAPSIDVTTFTQICEAAIGRWAVLQ